MTFLRASLRRLARAPVFTAATIVTLGLGLGAVAAAAIATVAAATLAAAARVLRLDPLRALRAE